MRRAGGSKCLQETAMSRRALVFVTRGPPWGLAVGAGVAGTCGWVRGRQRLLPASELLHRRVRRRVVTAKRPPPPPAPRPLCTTRSRPLPLVALIPSPRRCRLTRRRGQRPPRELAWSPANSGSGAAAPALRGACEWLFPSGSRLAEVARGTCRRALRPRLGPHAAVRPQTPRDADSQLPLAPKTTLLLRAALSPQTRAS